MEINREFRFTFVDEATLLQRLSREITFLFVQLKLAWPQLKHDPIGFSRTTVLALASKIRRALEPNTLGAVTTAIIVMLSAFLILFWIDNRSRVEEQRLEGGDIVQMIEFPPDPNLPSPSNKESGIGAASKGRVGVAAGTGEGSAHEHKKATGGGAGGQRDPLPAQAGKLPPPSDILAPIPKFPPVHKLALPVAGIDIDPALWRNQAVAVYGDPRSPSTKPSNGPGDEGGMGTANGLGVGEGSGPGFGPGKDGNTGGDRRGFGSDGPGGSDGDSGYDPERVYPPRQVTERARVLVKPEPQYTEEARRNAISGSVVLRVIFSRTGEVTNIRAVQTLPFGLTERAIAAARLIRFRPASKDGRPVNVPMQLEYNFNLY